MEEERAGEEKGVVVELYRSETEYVCSVDEKYLVVINVMSESELRDEREEAKEEGRTFYYGSVFACHFSDIIYHMPLILSIYDMPYISESAAVWHFDKDFQARKAIEKVRQFSHFVGLPWINTSREFSEKEWQGCEYQKRLDGEWACEKGEEKEEEKEEGSIDEQSADESSEAEETQSNETSVIEVERNKQETKFVCKVTDPETKKTAEITIRCIDREEFREAETKAKESKQKKVFETTEIFVDGVRAAKIYWDTRCQEFTMVYSKKTNKQERYLIHCVEKFYWGPPLCVNTRAEESDWRNQREDEEDQ